MKKIFLLATILVLGTTNAFAGCGDIAGYDEKGHALYYDDCEPDVALVDTLTPVYSDRFTGDPTLPAIDWNNPSVTDDDACDGVICPSGMACSDGCCLLK